MDTTIENKSSGHKKVYGYLGCFVILASLVSGETSPFIAQDNLSISTDSPQVVVSSSKRSISQTTKVSLNTEAPNRVYFVNDQPVEVDTSKKGWIVELMYAQKKKEDSISK